MYGMRQPESKFLSSAERHSLEALQRKERDKRLSDRIRVILLLDAGWTYDQVASAVFLHRTTVQDYYELYTEKGEEGFLTLHYSGKACQLDAKQLEQVKDWVRKTTPATALQVVGYIEESFAIQYSLAAVTTLLHRLGFVYKKPLLVPGKADADKQKEFLAKLEKLKQELGTEDKLLYMDGVHPQHNSKPAYGWMEKGKEKVLKANSGRKRININGVLEPEEVEAVIQISESVNAQSTVQLFQKLEKRYPNAKRIVAVSDNARYYRSKIIQEYLKHSRVELFFLPPYSPNLNLIERLWRFMNKKVRNNKYYEKFTEFENAVLNFFNDIYSYKEELSRLLVPKFHVINV